MPDGCVTHANSNSILKTDVDYQTTNRKNRDSSPEAAATERAQLREELHRYRLEPGAFVDYPSETMVREIIAATGGRPVAVIIRALRMLYETYPPTHKYGPHSWAWFKRVLPDYFEREQAWALPPAAASTHNPVKFEEMTEFMELPGEVSE
jgi:hypothetical protein